MYTLSPEAQTERKIMQLPLKIKNGTPPMRQVSLLIHYSNHLSFTNDPPNPSLTP